MDILVDKALKHFCMLKESLMLLKFRNCYSFVTTILHCPKGGFIWLFSRLLGLATLLSTLIKNLHVALVGTQTAWLVTMPTIGEI